MSSVKTQLHSDGNKVFPVLFELCLATIGVAFFSALTSVGALFLFVNLCAERRRGFSTSKLERAGSTVRNGIGGT